MNAKRHNTVGTQLTKPFADPMEPLVERILNAARINDAGKPYFANYASLVVELHGLDAEQDSRVFIQLALFAEESMGNGQKRLASTLSNLARIGLVPLVKKQRVASRPEFGGERWQIRLSREGGAGGGTGRIMGLL